MFVYFNCYFDVWEFFGELLYIDLNLIVLRFFFNGFFNFSYFYGVYIFYGLYLFVKIDIYFFS